MRLILADENRILRDALKDFLRRLPALEIVGETADGFEVLELVERFSPDVLVLEPTLPGIDGMEITRRLRRSGNEVRIIFLADETDQTRVAWALDAGVHGYVVKQAPGEDLVRAIEAVHNGTQFISVGVSQRETDEPLRTGADLYSSLTPREREVFQLIAQGMETHQVASTLEISPKTVGVHRLNIARKTGLRTQLDFFLQEQRRKDPHKTDT